MTKYQVREKNPNWKGGRVIDPRGYVLIKVGKDHLLADVRGYAYEHRLEAEKKLGRRLRKKEEIHHKSSRSDNSHDKIEIAKNKLHHAVFLGSPNHPCPPWEDRTKQISENVRRFGHCTPLSMGGF